MSEAIEKARPQADVPKETASSDRGIAALQKALAEQDETVLKQQKRLEQNLNVTLKGTPG